MSCAIVPMRATMKSGRLRTRRVAATAAGRAGVLKTPRTSAEMARPRCRRMRPGRPGLKGLRRNVVGLIALMTVPMMIGKWPLALNVSWMTLRGSRR